MGSEDRVAPTLLVTPKATYARAQDIREYCRRFVPSTNTCARALDAVSARIKLWHEARFASMLFRATHDGGD